MSDLKYEGLSSLQYATAGAVSGFVTRFTCQPLDVLKILFQLQVDPKSSSKYTSIFQAISVIVKEEGFSALWKGHVPAQFLSVAYGAIQFASYEKIVKLGRQFEKRNNEISLSHSSLHFYAGGISGVIGITLSFPFDTLRTRLIAQQKSKLYKGVFDGGRQIWMNEGLKGYFRGLLPACLQIAPSSALVFGFKNIYSQIWNQYMTGLPDTYEVSGKGHMVTGLFAGVSAKLVVYPLDVIKKRLQIHGMDKSSMSFRSASGGKGFIGCLLFTFKNEGFLGMYKGITPALLKSGLASAVNFTAYNEMCQLLDYLNS